jgi:hypothetical protein
MEQCVAVTTVESSESAESSEKAFPLENGVLMEQVIQAEEVEGMSKIIQEFDETSMSSICSDDSPPTKRLKAAAKRVAKGKKKKGDKEGLKYVESFTSISDKTTVCDEKAHQTKGITNSEEEMDDANLDGKGGSMIGMKQSCSNAAAERQKNTETFKTPSVAPAKGNNCRNPYIKKTDREPVIQADEPSTPGFGYSECFAPTSGKETTESTTNRKRKYDENLECNARSTTGIASEVAPTTSAGTPKLPAVTPVKGKNSGNPYVNKNAALPTTSNKRTSTKSYITCNACSKKWNVANMQHYFRCPCATCNNEIEDLWRDDLFNHDPILSVPFITEKQRDAFTKMSTEFQKITRSIHRKGTIDSDIMESLWQMKHVAVGERLLPDDKHIPNPMHHNDLYEAITKCTMALEIQDQAAFQHQFYTLMYFLLVGYSHTLQSPGKK